MIASVVFSLGLFTNRVVSDISLILFYRSHSVLVDPCVVADPETSPLSLKLIVLISVLTYVVTASGSQLDTLPLGYVY